MPTPVDDYRWQDHRARLGPVDLAVAVATAAALSVAVMAGWPAGGGSARLAADPPAPRIAGAACAGPAAKAGERHIAPGKDDA